MKDLATRVKEVEKTVNKNIKDERKEFQARSLTVTGDISVRLPGRTSYEGVSSFSVSYEQPMKVAIVGRMLETKEGIALEQGRMQITAYRENPAENALERSEDDIVLRKPIPDPEITIYQQGKKIVLNQVIGIPIVSIAHGSVTYV